MNFEHLCKDNVNEWNIKAKNVFFDLNSRVQPFLMKR